MAALLLGIAAFAALEVLKPVAPPTVTVVTARHDLAAGSVLSARDVAETSFPAELAPAHRAGAAELIGKTLNGAVARGSVLTTSALAGTAWAELPRGFAAVPARISDVAIAALLQPGQRVDLAAVDPRAPSEAHRLVSGAVVLAVPSVDTRASSVTGRMVVFRVPADRADLVTSSAVSRYLTVVWRR